MPQPLQDTQSLFPQSPSAFSLQLGVDEGAQTLTPGGASLNFNSVAYCVTLDRLPSPSEPQVPLMCPEGVCNKSYLMGFI